MTKPVRVPDPVYEKIERQADREDVTNGAVVRDWMEKAEKYDQIEVRNR